MSSIMFGPELLPKALDGRKTVTRRTLYGYQGFKRQYNLGIANVHPGPSTAHVGHIRILQVKTVRLGDIDDADIEREGFESRDDFIAYWMKVNRGAWRPNEPVYRIEFEPAPLCGACISPAAAAARS